MHVSILNKFARSQASHTQKYRIWLARVNKNRDKSQIFEWPKLNKFHYFSAICLTHEAIYVQTHHATVYTYIRIYSIHKNNETPTV